MKLDQLLDMDLLHDHLLNKVITERHFFPEGKDTPLRILNYTAAAQYGNIWDNVTRQCRGLIYNNDTRDVIARPFVKFFNVNDPRFPETMMENLPATEPILYEKYDGSLGIIFEWEGKYHVATRGSFHSEQAEWATKWIQAKDTEDYPLNFPLGYTPLVEIIYKGNRIVVDYKDCETLVLLGLVNVETGIEGDDRQLEVCSAVNGLPKSNVGALKVTEAIAQNIDNSEGYVAAWHFSDKPSFRVKIKFEDYCRLHRLLTQCNARTIWEMLVAGKNVQEEVAHTPLEFQSWVANIERELVNKFEDLLIEAKFILANAPRTTRKDTALYICKNTDKLQGACFLLLDGRDPSVAIFKLIEPRGDRVFKVDIDN